MVKHIRSHASFLARNVSAMQSSEFRVANIATYYQSRNLEFTIPYAYLLNMSIGNNGVGRIYRYAHKNLVDCVGHVQSVTFHTYAGTACSIKGLQWAGVRVFASNVDDYFVGLQFREVGNELINKVQIVIHSVLNRCQRKEIEGAIFATCFRRIQTDYWYQMTTHTWARVSRKFIRHRAR
jgi:hypothetical protein